MVNIVYLQMIYKIESQYFILVARLLILRNFFLRGYKYLLHYTSGYGQTNFTNKKIIEKCLRYSLIYTLLFPYNLKMYRYLFKIGHPLIDSLNFSRWFLGRIWNQLKL